MLIIVNSTHVLFIVNLMIPIDSSISISIHDLVVHAIVCAIIALASEALMSRVILEWWQHLLVVGADVWVI